MLIEDTPDFLDSSQIELPESLVKLWVTAITISGLRGSFL
jgi:hypothetical protein